MSNPQKFVESRLRVAEGIVGEIAVDMKVREDDLHPAESELDSSYLLARQFARCPRGNMCHVLNLHRLESAERILGKFVRGMEERGHLGLGRPLAIDYGLACRFLGKWPRG